MTCAICNIQCSEWYGCGASVHVNPDKPLCVTANTWKATMRGQKPIAKVYALTTYAVFL